MVIIIAMIFIMPIGYKIIILNIQIPLELPLQKNVASEAICSI